MEWTAGVSSNHPHANKATAALMITMNGAQRVISTVNDRSEEERRDRKRTPVNAPSSHPRAIQPPAALRITMNAAQRSIPTLNDVRAEEQRGRDEALSLFVMPFTNGRMDVLMMENG